jgi:purine-binding chemotaxis protein CheW
MATTTRRQWLIFGLSGQAYGFDVAYVREIVSLRSKRIHRLPQTPALVEGVVLLRDRPIEVVDVRSALGLPSLRMETEGITETLRQREEDHCRWLQELEACMRERREFQLATDPHRCKFGQWYDALVNDPQAISQLTNHDLALANLLEQLDQPHQRIHAIARRVASHVTAGRLAEARQIIDETRDTELAALRRLFSKCREQIRIVKRGLLFVFVEEDGLVGGIVDRVSEVLTLSDDQIQPAACASLADSTLVGVARWGAAGGMVQLLHVPAITRLRKGSSSAGSPCVAS